MKRDLGTRFPRRRKINLSESMVMQNQMLSTLKENFYDIYEAKQAAKNQVTVLNDYTYSIFGYLFSMRLRSNPQNDLLKNISPSFEKEEG